MYHYCVHAYIYTMLVCVCVCVCVVQERDIGQIDQEEHLRRSVVVEY